MTFFRPGIAWILYTFIDYVLALPDELEEDFMQNMREFEDSQEKHYVTSAERIGIKKGLEQGLEKGKWEGQKEILNLLLINKFGQVPAVYLTKIRDATPEKIQEWCKKILTANNINELFD